MAVDKFGRILIPKKLRDALGLHAGTEVSIETHENVIQLVPVVSEGQLVREGRHAYIVNSGSTDIDIPQLIEDMREGRMRQIAGLGSGEEE